MTDTLQELVESIPSVDATWRERARACFDAKTKPLGSLGRIESLAATWCAARGAMDLAIPRKAIVVMAADHGIVDEGVSAYPREVTRQMLSNFANGGAAINVLARQVGAKLLVVDMGVAGEPTAGVRDCRIAPGTANFARGPAMSRMQAERAVACGAALAHELVAEGMTLVGIGEMGIGNTTAASALVAAFLRADPRQVVGRGTGVDDAGLARKREVVARALARRAADTSEPLDVLADLGGFEIAGLVGLVLGAAAARVPVLLDGFITGAAALVAARLAPNVQGRLIASHRSVEPGHALTLEHLGLQPLLELDLRLGEGTGAALAMPLVDAAVRLLDEMATFESAGVSRRSG